MVDISSALASKKGKAKNFHMNNNLGGGDKQVDEEINGLTIRLFVTHGLKASG